MSFSYVTALFPTIPSTLLVSYEMSVHMHKRKLRKLVSDSLRAQGFHVHRDRIVPSATCKEGLRQLHSTALGHRVARAAPGLIHVESDLLGYIASGAELDPVRIKPRLVEVKSKSTEELLFRYACLHWSVPVSSGYGRRLRFLVMDEHNQKLMGIFGLGDPIFALRARDNWVGWNAEQRRARLQHVMDAFVLGAVPPYSFLLGGKLVAMLTTSEEVRSAFRRKYRGREALISGKQFDGRLALITTTSALGRSSLYNRIRFADRRGGERVLFHSVGYTSGSGDFHFANGLYREIYDYVEKNCAPSAKNERWGTGFRNRREIIRKCLAELGFSDRLAYHGVEREVYVAPLAKNTRQFLRGEHARLQWHHQTVDELFSYFRSRWLLPRAERDQRYREYDASAYRLWKDGDDQ